MIKNIVFDYGGVLTFGKQWDPVVWDYYDGDKSKASSTISKAIEAWDKSRNGEGDSKEFWNSIANNTGQNAGDVKKDILAHFSINPQIISLLKRLKEYYRLILFSNQLEDWLETVIKEAALDKLFSEIITSYNSGYSKPDPKIFEHMRDKLSLNFSETMFVDDTQKNIDAADSLGIDSIQFTDYENLISELGKRGIKLQ